ncbi:hypothetical protein [Rhodococcus sp. Q]|uniref:hypothetical protein n=1 Tax=Rhodococcus sp. Q TaxID=2502252 RepID=UPI0010F9E32B|nr:hypothetical protein [Rhodococcus sp. Q]
MVSRRHPGAALAVTVAAVLGAAGCASDTALRRVPPPSDLHMMSSIDDAPLDWSRTFRPASEICTGMARYLDVLEAGLARSGLPDRGREYEATWMLDLRRSTAAWALASDEERSEVERGYHDAVRGDC